METELLTARNFHRWNTTD